MKLNVANVSVVVASALVVAAGVVGTAQKSPASRQNAPVTSQNTTSSAMAGMPASGGTTDEPNVELTSDQIAKQNQVAADLLHEKALTPKLLADGTKQFTLTTSTFPWALWQGETVQAWGYNNQVAGPLIRVKVGDKVEIVVHNHLPDGTTVHWHGLAVPIGMDGVPGVSQDPIQPGGTFVYRFTVTPQMVGTHYYHSHYHDLTQVDNGLYGPLIVDPATPSQQHYDVDALYVLSSWMIAGLPDSGTGENAFSMDGKPYPNAPQLNVKLGQRVLVRLVNASANCAHAMHLHGYTFQVVAIDGNPVAHPQSQNTVTLLPGETADIAFTANNPGQWMFHCHILDHTMNPGDEADDMGGLMTFINVQK